MINTTGQFLSATLASFQLTGKARKAAGDNAGDIVTNIVDAYESNVGTVRSRSKAKSVPAKIKKKGKGVIGLVYGRIQSGKTRAMIISTALAFDNGFKIVVVLTSNINDLVSQTHGDFAKDLPGVTVFSKDDELDLEVASAKLDMDDRNGRILMIGSKGAKSLQNIIGFLSDIGAVDHPMIVFDDEGDQASLDTNVYKRTSGGGLTLQPSTINNLILRLRNNFPASVFVSVTGTPQALLLQSASTDMRPSFVVMLPHGADYIGGGHFSTHRNRKTILTA
jgi:hypothetical protein